MDVGALQREVGISENIVLKFQIFPGETDGPAGRGETQTAFPCSELSDSNKPKGDKSQKGRTEMALLHITDGFPTAR